MPDAPAVTKVEVRLEIDVSVRWDFDPDPDLSMLGKYSNEYAESAIDREKRGDMKRGEYRYWHPANHANYDPKNWDHVDNNTKRDLIKKHGSLANTERAYREEDYLRHEEYNNGAWLMEGCVVKARFKGLTAQASLWGIESDSDPKYQKEVESDVTSEAVELLKQKILKRLEVE